MAHTLPGVRFACQVMQESFSFGRSRISIIHERSTHDASSFNERQITLIVYQSGRDRCPYLLLRTFHMGTPWFSLHGAHELCVERNGSSLQFWRWSSSEHCPKMWANLCFMTWEGMLLLANANGKFSC